LHRGSIVRSESKERHHNSSDCENHNDVAHLSSPQISNSILNAINIMFCDSDHILAS
jgi:hypothetical protein